MSVGRGMVLSGSQDKKLCVVDSGSGSVVCAFHAGAPIKWAQPIVDKRHVVATVGESNSVLKLIMLKACNL